MDLLMDMDISRTREKIEKLEGEICKMNEAISENNSLIDKFKNAEEKLDMAQSNITTVISRSCEGQYLPRFVQSIPAFFGKVVNGKEYANARESMSSASSECIRQDEEYQEALTKLKELLANERAKLGQLEQAKAEAEAAEAAKAAEAGGE